MIELCKKKCYQHHVQYHSRDPEQINDSKQVFHGQTLCPPRKAVQIKLDISTFKLLKLKSILTY